MIKSLDIKIVSVDVLKPHPKNPHVHSKEQIERLCQIIEYQGFRNPITVDIGSGFMVAGHGRLDAAKKLGYKEVPVTYQKFDNEEQVFAHMVADNAIGKDTWATLDLSLINDIVPDLGPDFDIDMLGLKDFEIELADKYASKDPDEVPENVETRCKPGDLWILGEHRLLCGDSTNIQHVERLMGEKKANLIITDPPYNVSYVGKTSKKMTIQNDTMDDEGFFQFLLDVYKNLFIAADDGAGIYVFHADSEGANFRRAMVMGGWKLAQCCIWVKSSMVMGRQDYHWQHEPILVGWKPTAAHNWYADRKQTTIWKFDRPNRNGEHPTMKPIELICYPMENSSKRGDIVLDLFLSSGSTLIASEKMGRVCYGMELDPKYCDVIIKRWEDFTNKEASLEQ